MSGRTAARLAVVAASLALLALAAREASLLAEAGGGPSARPGDGAGDLDGGGDPVAEALALRGAGERRAAAAVLRGVADDDASARLLLAEILVEDGRFGPAVNELLRLEKQSPDLFEAEGAELLDRARSGLRPVAEAGGVREAAQVFVVPDLLGGTRRLWRPLAHSGADLVFVRAFHLEGDRTHEGRPSDVAEGAYFPAKRVPLVEDRLGSDCAAARAAGLECWAWMTTRRTPLRGLDTRRHGGVSWDFRTGQMRRTEALDVFDPAVVTALEQTWRDLARAGVGGALFQDDLVLRHLEGFSPHARRRFRQRTGRPLDPRDLFEVEGRGESARVRYLEPFWEFQHFKRDRLLEVAERLRDAAREVRPDFDVALNLYYETALPGTSGLAWLAQDLDAAAERDFRWLAVMAYHRQIAHEMVVPDEAELVAGLRRMADRLAEVPRAEERVLVKLQAIDWRTREPIPPAELARVAEPFSRFALCLAPADDPELAAQQLEALRAARARQGGGSGGRAASGTSREAGESRAPRGGTRPGTSP